MDTTNHPVTGSGINFASRGFASRSWAIALSDRGLVWFSRGFSHEVCVCVCNLLSQAYLSHFIDKQGAPRKKMRALANEDLALFL